MKVDIFNTLKKYNIIYADPPWTFKTYSKKGVEKKSAQAHYECMDIKDIYNLPVQRLAEKDCILFMWVTFPLLQEGLETIKRWGFTYKTCGFTWVKRNKKSNTLFWGCGYWTRANSELCLIATRGKPSRISRSIHSVIESRIEVHSKKPDEARERIVGLCGDLPRIELFARQAVAGWDCWGDEAPEGEELCTS